MSFFLISIFIFFTSDCFSQLEEVCDEVNDQCDVQILQFAQEVIDNSESCTGFGQFVGIDSQCGTTGRIYSTAGRIMIGTLENNGSVTTGLLGLTIQPYLVVTDGIVAKSLKVVGSSWCDYVFDPDYQFLSLSETEEFVKKNKRLPGFKSEKEMISDGYFDLEEITIKQQEKIEELFLYTIQLEKEINALEKKK